MKIDSGIIGLPHSYIVQTVSPFIQLFRVSFSGPTERWLCPLWRKERQPLSFLSLSLSSALCISAFLFHCRWTAWHEWEKKKKTERKMVEIMLRGARGNCRQDRSVCTVQYGWLWTSGWGHGGKTQVFHLHVGNTKYNISAWHPLKDRGVFKWTGWTMNKSWKKKRKLKMHFSHFVYQHD